jgi:LPS-assembly protein
MQYFRQLFILAVLFPLAAQEDPILPPSPVVPPSPVQIPPIPFQKDNNPATPHEVGVVMPTGLNIQIKGKITPVEGDLKRLEVTGPIELKTNRGEEVFADRALLDMEAQTYTLQGNVSVFYGPVIQRGNSVVYNLKTRKLETNHLSVSYDPIILESGSFEASEDDSGNRYFTGNNAGITTQDVEEPNYWLRADTTTVYPNDRIDFRNMKLYIGDTPIFWLPYLSQPLHKDMGFRFIPGGRTNWGMYLLNTYGIMLGGGDNTLLGSETPWILSQWHLDLRTRRGVGAGVDLFDTRGEGNPNLGWLKLYYTYDLEPELGRSGIIRGPVDPGRYRAEFQYRIPLQIHDNDPDATYALNYDLHVLSDNHFLEDFDPYFYRSNAQPDNTIFLTRRTESSLLTGLARLRLNDFYRADSRSPEVIFDQIRRPVFGTSVLHEGSTSFGFIQENIADPTKDTLIEPLLTLPDGDPQLASLYPQVGRYEQFLIKQMRALPLGDPRYDSLYNQLTHPEFGRFHTYQEFSTQLTAGDWLHLTPRMGAGHSRYFNVGGPINDNDRTIFSSSMEASVKFKKDYPDLQWRNGGIDGIRHTLQPYAQWSYLSTSELGDDFPAIDRLTFTTRPVPINPGRFVAIDDMENWNLVRLGVRNRLLTHRDSGTHEWLFIDTYLDCYLNDPELDRQYSNLYNDITWSPLPWLEVDLQTQFPVISSGSGYSEFTTAVRFMPTPDFEFSVSQGNLSNHPYLLDSNRVFIKAYNRFNENWGAGLLHQWEFDDGTLELEQYTFHRNFSNWIISSGLTHRNNRDKDEYGFMLNFTLKDFPAVSVPFKIDAE